MPLAAFFFWEPGGGCGRITAGGLGTSACSWWAMVWEASSDAVKVTESRMTNRNRHGHEPRKHHYVPEFMLRPWAKRWRPNQILLRGYYWDMHARRLRYRENGIGAFCYRLDLLTLKGRAQNRAILESRFFQSIDEKGSAAVVAMAGRGPEGLSADERCDFARLVLSLEWRRPATIDRLRQEGRAQLMAGLDNDPEILEAFRAQDIAVPPSEYAEGTLGWSFEDRAVLIVQGLVDSKEVGERLINANWYLKRLRREHGSFVLGDRPLVRTHGLDNEAATWFVPLSPKLGFFATQHLGALKLIKRASARTIVAKANWSSAQQSERYVFSTDQSCEALLSKLLKPGP